MSKLTELKKLGYKVHLKAKGRTFMVRVGDKYTSAIVIEKDQKLTVLNSYKIDRLLAGEEL